MRSSSWPAALLAVLVGCDFHPDQVGFAWDRTSLQVGEVLLGTHKVFQVPWTNTRGEAVEVVDAVASCGCTKVRRILQTADAPCQGRLEPGQRGFAELEIRGAGTGGPLNSHVVVLWRTTRDEEVHGSKLQLAGTLVPAYRVSPAAVQAVDASPGAGIPFQVTWTALRPETNVDESALRLREDALLRQVSVSARRNAHGMFVVTAQGMVQSPQADRTASYGQVEVLGAAPPLPAVPVTASWRTLLRRTPRGVLELRPTASGDAVGRVTFACADPDRDVRIRALTVTPPSEGLRVRVDASASASPGHVEVVVSGRFPESERYAKGTVEIVWDDPDMGAIPVPWVYLKPPTPVTEQPR